MHARAENRSIAWTFAQTPERQALHARTDDLGMNQAQSRQALFGADVADFGDELALDRLRTALESVNHQPLGGSAHRLLDAMFVAGAIPHAFATSNFVAQDHMLDAASRIGALLLQTHETHPDPWAFGLGDDAHA